VPRAIPPDRFESLLDTAARVFIEQGYRRTQMADVAGRLGIASGTLYLYVESKEALFHEALRHADHTEPIPLPLQLPVATPRPEETTAMIRARVSREGRLPSLEAALARQRVTDIREELTDILRELHRLLSRHRTAIELIDRCALDRPDIAEAWYSAGRRGLTAGLDAYLADRARRRRLRRFPDPATVSRLVLETLTTWAVHLRWDPSPQDWDEARSEQTVVEFLVAALVPER